MARLHLVVLGPFIVGGLVITLRHTILGRNHLYERSACRRYLYLKTQNTQNRETYMPPAGFETSFPASKQLQTHALYRAVTGIGIRQAYPK